MWTLKKIKIITTIIIVIFTSALNIITTYISHRILIIFLIFSIFLLFTAASCTSTVLGTYFTTIISFSLTQPRMVGTILAQY